jgi:hypothetical protein
LIAQSGNALRGKIGGELGEKRMGHAGASAMAHDVAGSASSRNRQEAGDPMLVVDRDGQGFSRRLPVTAS